MRGYDGLVGLLLGGALVVGCGRQAAPSADAPPSIVDPVAVTPAVGSASVPATRSSALAAAPARGVAPASSAAPPAGVTTALTAASSAATATCGTNAPGAPPAPGTSERQADAGLPAGVHDFDAYDMGDDPPTSLRFAHATARGVLIHLGFASEFGLIPPYVERAVPRPLAVRGISPPIDIVPLEPIALPAELAGEWEVFAGSERICRGPLVAPERAEFLRNLDGGRSTACQEVADGLKRPLTAEEIREHYVLMTGFATDLVARVEGCTAPPTTALLWSRPVGAGAAPPNVSAWAPSRGMQGDALLSRTRRSEAWKTLSAEVEAEYAGSLPGVKPQSRRWVGRRAEASGSEPGWSVWTQLGTTFAWGATALGVAETSLWDLYTNDVPPRLWARHRVRNARDLEMVASGSFGDGVELIAIARAQCHDKWLMLAVRDGVLHVRRDLTVTCWCSD